ncbi:MAG: hypothetical protein KAH03_00790 [Cocleimonas sp.]|nr:hypothetical protein [Cocleimonas sp.]
MLKKIVIIVILLAITIATVLYFTTTDKTEVSLEANKQDATPLTEEESQAIQLLNDEMIYDQCVIYADEDNVKDEELKEYLSSCVEQLKAEATMIEPAEDEKNQKEILKQCGLYAEQDKVTKEKLDEYMDLCIEQLRSEATIIEPEGEEQSGEKEENKATNKNTETEVKLEPKAEVKTEAIDKESTDNTSKKAAE